MTDPIGSVGRARGARRLRGRKVSDTEAPRPAEEAAAAEAAAPIAPLDIPPPDGAPAVSAQIMGQGRPAENAPPANVAQQARAAYLSTEWSGKHDRRNPKGRIAKTDV